MWTLDSQWKTAISMTDRPHDGCLFSGLLISATLRALSMYPIHPSLSDHTQVQVQNSLSQGAELMSARGDDIEFRFEVQLQG